MADRYFVEEPIVGERAVLVGPEAHHLIHVMRARPGAEVVLFDGSGAEFTAQVARVGRSEVELRLLARAEVDRELPFELTLGVALPKGERQKWLVEKATELGVTRLVPLQTARGVAQPAEQVLARLRRGVIEASKQCGRNRLMEIAEPESWAQFVAAVPDAACRLVAHPYHSRPLGHVLAAGRSSGDCPDFRVNENGTVPFVPPIGSVFLAIGPEGGFTEEEVALALAAGWQPIDLGPRILRVETAAIVVTALLVHHR